MWFTLQCQNIWIYTLCLHCFSSLWQDLLTAIYSRNKHQYFKQKLYGLFQQQQKKQGMNAILDECCMLNSLKVWWNIRIFYRQYEGWLLTIEIYQIAIKMKTFFVDCNWGWCESSIQYWRWWEKKIKQNMIIPLQHVMYCE